MKCLTIALNDSKLIHITETNVHIKMWSLQLPEKEIQIGILNRISNCNSSIFSMLFDFVKQKAGIRKTLCPVAQSIILVIICTKVKDKTCVKMMLQRSAFTINMYYSASMGHSVWIKPGSKLIVCNTSLQRSYMMVFIKLQLDRIKITRWGSFSKNQIHYSNGMLN